MVGNFRGRRVEQEVLGQPALFLGDRGKALQLLRVDDREIEARLGAVVQEDRIDHFARRGRQSERDVRDAEHGLDVRTGVSLISRTASIVSTAPPM